MHCEDLDPDPFKEDPLPEDIIDPPDLIPDPFPED